MTLNQLQNNCVKKLPLYLTRGDETLLSLMGLNSASGDLLGMYKKTLFETSELPKEEFVEALGNCIYFVAISAHAVDVDLESIMKKVAASCENKEGEEC